MLCLNPNGFLRKKPPDIMASQSLLFEDGLILGKYPLGELLTDIDSIKSVQNQIKNFDEITLSIFAFLATNRKMILTDKKLFYLKNSQTIKLLETSDQDSTSAEKDLSPFWNESKKILSEKLWLPQKIVSVDLDLSSSNGFATNTQPSSWFSSTMILPQKKSSLQNSWTSSKFFAAGETEKDGIVTKSLKVRIYPKAHQKKLLQKWAHHNRYTYNMAVEKIQKDNIYNKRILRNELVTAENIPEEKQWLLETPKVIRQQAVFSASSNFKTALTNHRNGLIKHFNFIKKKENLWSMGLEKQISITKNGQMTIFKNKPYNFGSFRSRDKIFKNGRFKTILDIQKSGIYKPSKDCSIHKDKSNRYYLILPIEEKCQTPRKKKIVSIDPGIRKFMSAYSPDGECSFLGIDCRARLLELLKKLDFYDTIIANERTSIKQRKNLRKKKLGIYRKMRDLKRELHDKIINYLTKEFSDIILGRLNVSNVIRKQDRFLRTKEVRSLLCLSHYEFRTKLVKKSKERGVNAMVVNEAWTSKTCTGCGKINRGLGGAEEYNCSNCTSRIDRDLNGARNILLRTIGELTV